MENKLCHYLKWALNFFLPRINIVLADALSLRLLIAFASLVDIYSLIWNSSRMAAIQLHRKGYS